MVVRYETRIWYPYPRSQLGFGTPSLPTVRRIVGYNWVFRINENVDGIIDK